MRRLGQVNPAGRPDRSRLAMTCKRRGGDEQMFGANHQVPHAGGSYAPSLSFTAFGGASRADVEHESAPFRPAFFPPPACRYRGITGYHLRVLQAETGAGVPEVGQAARWAPA
jgi:hypothetical protein